MFRVDGDDIFSMTADSLGLISYKNLMKRAIQMHSSSILCVINLTF
uniref:Uncharacterized protein n=1 Tax=Anguilla anguilla TaxID=7936 RepID=A0A0E9ULT3_ANGAN